MSKRECKLPSRGVLFGDDWRGRVDIGSFSRVTLAESSVSTATFNGTPRPTSAPVSITATVEGGATGSARLQNRAMS